MDNVLWWIGWRARTALVLFLIVGITMSVLLKSVWGVLFGVPFIVLWIWGAMYINKHWYKLFEKGTETANKSGRKKLGVDSDEAEDYLLYRGRGHALLVKPAKEYVLTVLYVGESFLGIYEDCVYSVIKRTNYAGSGTKELYYRHINSVDYQSPYFQVRTSSGEILQYQSNHENANSALNAVRKELRQAQT